MMTHDLIGVCVEGSSITSFENFIIARNIHRNESVSLERMIEPRVQYTIPLVMTQGHEEHWRLFINVYVTTIL